MADTPAIVDNPTELAATQATPMDFIRDATASGASVETLEKLMDLNDRWEAKQSRAAFDQAVSNFQAECPQIKKDRKGVHNVAFASYDDIMAVIQPILSRNGLHVSFDSSLADGLMAMSCHVSGHGHKHTSHGTLPVPKEMKVNDAQKMGAAFSYGRRYILCNALNIITTGEDRDAAGIDAPRITDNQAMALGELLDQLPKDRHPGFKKWYGVENIADIPANRYKDALASLKRAVADEAD